MSYIPFILAQTSENIESLKKLLMNPNGAMVAGSILVMMILSWRSGQTGTSKKNRLATAHWAGPQERSSARKKAHQQVNDRRANAVSLFISAPVLDYLPSAKSKPRLATPTLKGKKVVRIKRDNRTTWLPDAQRGIAVLGGPGSGKTHSVIDPALRSVIDQGFPLVLYDFVRFVG